MKSFLMGGGIHSRNTFLMGGLKSVKIIGVFKLDGVALLDGTKQIGVYE